MTESPTPPEIDEAPLAENQPPAGGLEKPLVLPFDLEYEREKARRTIAMMLVGILAGIVLGAGGLLTMILFRRQGDVANDAGLLVRVLEIVFGPVVALVASAVGFYYGTRDKGLRSGKD